MTPMTREKLLVMTYIPRKTHSWQIKDLQILLHKCAPMPRSWHTKVSIFWCHNSSFGGGGRGGVPLNLIQCVLGFD
jgi:hypothetical protein